MSELSTEGLFKSFYFSSGADPTSRKLFRPVVMASFAVNWYLGGDNVVGYHIANIVIHFLTALLLFHTMVALLKTPNEENAQTERLSCFAALLAASLWAVHPIQTQAVTYIVQRMASMAGLFCIAGLYCYVKARQSADQKRMVLYGAGCLLWYLLAIGSKLNAMVLPLAYVLVEITFFQDMSTRERRLKLAGVLIVAGLLVLFLGLTLLAFLKGNPIGYIQNGYDSRPFTLWERLMTEARVLVFYLSQIIYPIPQRLSFMHDIGISHSLISPWTTLVSVAVVCALIGFSILRLPRYRLLSFAILFFFINHTIESSIIPLELVFEHRNYIPSMFLFLPLAYGLTRFIHSNKTQRPGLIRMVAAGTAGLVMFLGLATYSRNHVWGTEERFWLDTLGKSPQSARPYMQLADFYSREGQNDLAMRLYNKSLSLYDPVPKRARALALTNMGLILNNQGDYNGAATLYRQSLEVNPAHEIARYNLVFTLIASGQLDDALQQAEILARMNPTHPYYLNAVGYILIQLDRMMEAESYLVASMSIKPDSPETLINLGFFMSRTGNYPAADSLFRQAYRLAPGNPTALLGLIENSIRTPDPLKAEGYANTLVEHLPVARILAIIDGSSGPKPLYDERLIRMALSNSLKAAVR
jgi:Flp pilus assembly protein TadD